MDFRGRLVRADFGSQSAANWFAIFLPPAISPLALIEESLAATLGIQIQSRFEDDASDSTGSSCCCPPCASSCVIACVIFPGWRSSSANSSSFGFTWGRQRGGRGR